MATMQQAEFARLINMDKGHITRLKQAGRLVLTDTGLVDVEASLERLAATSGNSPQARAQQERWLELRNARNRPATPPPDDTAGLLLGGQGMQDVTSRLGVNTKAQALRKLKADADCAEMERDKLQGRLIDRDEVRRDLTNAVATILNAFEGLPDRCAPLLINQDDMAITRAVLRDEVEHCLHTVAVELNAIPKERQHEPTR